ncbi:MAG: hypothetical protein ABIH18_09180 [Candidatus Omnitrophota bacterium]
MVQEISWAKIIVVKSLPMALKKYLPSSKELAASVMVVNHGK